MNENRSTTFAWIAVLFLAAAGVTLAAFYSLITPEYRGKTFYQAAAGCCVAELVFSAFLAFTLSAGTQRGAPGHAVRLRVMTLVTVWAVVMIIGSAVAVAPAHADSFYSDKILIWQLIFTFFMVGAAYFMQRQGAVVEAISTEPQRQRTQVQSYASGVERLLPRIQALSGKQPAKAIEVDRLHKRVDTLRTQLMSNLPIGERAAGRLVEPPAPEQVEDRLRELHDQVDRLCGADAAAFDAELEKTRQAVDAAVAALRQRRDSGLR
jgi:hypothetical protein